MRRGMALASCALLCGLALTYPKRAVAQEAPGGAAADAATGVRSPAFAADGRLAVAVGGDLWVLEPDGTGGFRNGRRITRGAPWDRDPAWTADGRALIFSSDRSGAINLWRIELNPPDAAPLRLTSSTEQDVEPTVAADGSIVFARGRGGDSDLWLRTAAGAERRLTQEPGAERDPAWSPDGQRLTYVAVRSGRRELRVRGVDGGDVVIVADRQARAPSWSPDGGRIAFGAEGRDAGIWTVAPDGRYAQAAGSGVGEPAWSPDGGWIVVAMADAADGGYNGDPDRLGERSSGDVLALTGGLQRIAAPPPVAAPSVVSVLMPADRAGRNGAAFDRAWARAGRLYLGLTGELSLDAPASGESALAARWRAVGRKHRPAAIAAADEAALRDAIYAALRERPVRPEATGRAGVSSAHPLATAAGVEILQAGGNVVDAAVAVSFALGVVEPDASGIGGYGEMLIHLRGMAEPASIEFMTRLPAAAGLDNAAAVDAIPRNGPGVANVPGTVAGMELAWKRHGSGRVPWARLLDPAIRLAERGFPLDDGFATTLRREREGFERYESSRRLFFRDGQPLAVGDTLRNPDLAWALKEIARHGADAFYRGEVGRRMVEDLRRGGNLMTLDDLQRYVAAERRAVRTSYRGNDVFSGPPPVTGGASLLGKLNLLELTPAGRSMTEESATLHAMLEAWKFQPSTGGRIADPDLWPIDTTPFESKDTARARWKCFQMERATPANALVQPECGRDVSTRAARSPVDNDMSCDVASNAVCADLTISPEECLAYDRDCRATGTTAYVVADADGNIVSVTQTLGTWGGNFYVTPGLGFLYNDKLRSYGSNPNGYNARVPFARNTTVIAPTIVFRGSGAARRPWFGVGAAGNAWITSAVYQMVVGIVDHGLSAQQALELPRFLPGGRVTQIENAFSPRVLRELEQMGHAFQPISLLGELRMGYGAAVVIEGNRIRAGGDPRRAGAGGATR